MGAELFDMGELLGATAGGFQRYLVDVGVSAVGTLGELRERWPDHWSEYIDALSAAKKASDEARRFYESA